MIIRSSAEDAEREPEADVTEPLLEPEQVPRRQVVRDRDAHRRRSVVERPADHGRDEHVGIVGLLPGDDGEVAGRSWRAGEGRGRLEAWRDERGRRRQRG